VEAQRQLLVNGAVGVEQNMGGVAVDTGEPGERDGHSRLLGDLADHRLGGGLADLKASSAQLPVAVIDPADQKDLAGDVADRRERRRQHVVRAGGVRIPVVLAQPHHHRFSFISSATRWTLTWRTGR
jgi:hypothetical protein